MKTKLKTILSAATLAAAITFAPVAKAENGSHIAGGLLAGGVGCAAGAALAVYDEDRGWVCGVAGVATLALYLIVVTASNNNAVPDSRWSFDGGDGMPKAVYSLSDATKLSFGAKGESLDYDGVAVGVKYSF
ncbi:MAG: hypothetical protein ACR2P4_07100 [Gammaproteobacteria bacterium]